MFAEPEEVEAPNEKSLRDVYELMGCDIRIVQAFGKEESSGGFVNNPARYENLPEDGTYKPPEPGQQNDVQEQVKTKKPTEEKPFFFKRGGMEFKMQGSKLYMKDWIPLEMKYRITTEDKVEVLDWVEMSEEE